MFCKRCGNEIADVARICPTCGTSIEHAHAHVNIQPHTSYGSYPQSSNDATAQQQRGYAPQPERPPRPRNTNTAYSPYTNGYTVPPTYPGPSTYQQPYNNYAPRPQAFTVIQKNDTALVTEIILSLFGIFGVGWLMARETTIGTVLLVCSFLIYWPIIILGTLLTFGLGLICLGPLAIAAIILNIIWFNGVLNKKANHFVVVPPLSQNRPVAPMTTMPPPQL